MQKKVSEEKRKQKRYPANIHLTIASLYKQDEEMIENINQQIDIIDISKAGVGFICPSELPLNYYFNAKINFGGKKFFYTVVKIIRVERDDNLYKYGCEFVGLADVLSSVVDDYGNFIEGY